MSAELDAALAGGAIAIDYVIPLCILYTEQQ